VNGEIHEIQPFTSTSLHEVAREKHETLRKLDKEKGRK
jgi:hypothetical protein